MSDYSLSRISDFDSHMTPAPELSEFDPYGEGSDDSLQEEIALYPRR
jgi:hypothetical protein